MECLEIEGTVGIEKEDEEVCGDFLGLSRSESPGSPVSLPTPFPCEDGSHQILQGARSQGNVCDEHCR